MAKRSLKTKAKPKRRTVTAAERAEGSRAERLAEYAKRDRESVVEVMHRNGYNYDGSRRTEMDEAVASLTTNTKEATRG